MDTYVGLIVPTPAVWVIEFVYIPNNFDYYCFFCGGDCVHEIY